MRTGQYLNTTADEMLAKPFNIVFGFSLGNKYFTPDHIRSYLQWALSNTKEKVAVIIPDKIHAVNYEVKSGYTPQRSMAVALRKGKEIEGVVLKVIEELGTPAAGIRVLHWQEIEDATYTRMLDVITTAFRDDAGFRDTVIRMVKEAPQLGSLGLIDPEYEKLAQYILDELPLLIGGCRVDGTYYGALPYPGFANLDYLAIDLQEGTSFPEITAKLNIQDKLRLVELYAD